MTPTVELLLQDIEYEQMDIENLSEDDFKQVFDTYTSLYNRCLNLKKEDFDSAEIYERFIRHVKSSNNSNFITLNWLEQGIDSASVDDFSTLREMLSFFLISLKYAY